MIRPEPDDQLNQQLKQALKRASDGQIEYFNSIWIDELNTILNSDTVYHELEKQEVPLQINKPPSWMTKEELDKLVEEAYENQFRQ